MINARAFPKSWLKTYSNWLGHSSSKSNRHIWRDAHRPEVERRWSSNEDPVRLWRIATTPDGVEGRVVDLFIEKELLLDEAITAYGSIPAVLEAIADKLKQD